MRLSGRAIARLKEFWFQLLTIAVGLLIAVGVDNFFEWRNHEQLLTEARSAMRAEIRANAAKVDAVLQQIKDERVRMQANLDVLARFQKPGGGPKLTELNLGGSLINTLLSDTAWKAAFATAAFTYMPYDEAQRYSQIYELQAQLRSQQNSISEDAAAFLGLIRKMRPLDDNELTPEQASDVAERCGIWQVHLLSLTITVRSIAELQSAFLENRPAREAVDDSIGSRDEIDAATDGTRPPE